MIEYLVIITTLSFVLNTILLANISLNTDKANIRIDFIEFLVRFYNERK